MKPSHIALTAALVVGAAGGGFAIGQGTQRAVERPAAKITPDGCTEIFIAAENNMKGYQRTSLGEAGLFTVNRENLPGPEADFQEIGSTMFYPVREDDPNPVPEEDPNAGRPTVYFHCFEMGKQ